MAPGPPHLGHADLLHGPSHIGLPHISEKKGGVSANELSTGFWEQIERILKNDQMDIF